MAIYSVVDEGYDVTICKSIDALCDEIRGCAYAGGELYLGREHNALKATIKNIKAHLKDPLNSVFWVYREGEDDWALKVRRHK